MDRRKDLLKTADFRDFCRGLWRIAFASVFGILSFVCLGYGEAVNPDEPSHTVIYSCGYVEPLTEFSVGNLSGDSGGKDGGQSGSSSPVSVNGTPPSSQTCNDSSRCYLFSIDSVDNNPCASAGYTFDHWECNHWGVAINWEEDGYGGGSWNSYFDMSDHMAGSGYTFEQIEESCNDTVYCEAKWVKTDYTVSFSPGIHGNGSMTALTKNYTDTVTLPSNGFTADAGYRFVNWKDLKSSVYKNAGQTFTMPDEDVTWVAQWTLINYTVSFDANGGSGTTGGQTNKHIGDTITLPSSAFTAPTGYQFNGWNCGASVNNGNDLQPGNTFTMPAENVTCAAQWAQVNYTVSFDANGGSGTMNSQTNKYYGDTITLPSNGFTAPNGNYLFIGWKCGSSVNNNATLAANDTFTMPAANVTCTAQWGACSCSKGTGVNVCNVTGVSNNQCQYSYTCDSDYHVSRQNNDVQNGTFAGNAGVTNNSISCDEDVITYNVVYNCNNNDDGIDPEDGHSPYTVGTGVVVLSDESTCKIPMGKSFSGWFCYKTGDKNTKVDDRPSFRMPAYDVTCDAQWDFIDYTVAFVAGDGSGTMSSQTNKHYQDTITLPSSTFTAPTGKEFDKWSCEKTGGGSISGYTVGDSSFTMPAANVTCTAQWKFVNYTVTYYGGNCTSNSNSYTDATTATYGSTYNILQATDGNLVDNIIGLNVNNSCARFKGWSASSDSSVLTYPCLENSDELDYGVLTCNPQLTISNYPASNTSLYAVCEPRTYDVVYHNDCANLVNQTSTDSNGLTYGVSYTLKGLNSTAMPTGISMPAGYDFAGWKINGATYTNSNPTYTYTSSGKCSAGPIDVYAGCDPENYTVYYYTGANSQTPVASSSVTMGGTYAIGNASAENASCTGTGESFLSWDCYATDNDNTSVDDGDDVVPYDVNCRPECIVNATTYNVSFVAGDGSGTMSSQTGKHYGDTITLPDSTFTPPTPAGKYTFDKWNCDNNIGNKAAGATFSMPAANVTCTAQWKLKNYTVGFVHGDSNNNGTGTSATGSAYYITRQYQTTVTLPENTYFTAPSGYEFDKWKCDNSVGEKMVGDTFSMPAANVTCTAQWRQVSAPVSTTTVSFVCVPSNATTLRPEVSPEIVNVGEEHRFVSEDVCTLNGNSGWEFKSVGCFDDEGQSVLVTSEKDEIIIDNVPNSPVTCSLYYGPTGVDIYPLDICTVSGYTNNPTLFYYGSGNTPYLNYTNGALADEITASPNYQNPVIVPNDACFIGYSYEDSCTPNATGLNYPLFNSYGEWTGQYIGNGWAQYLNGKYAVKLDSTGADAGRHGTEFLWYCSDNDPSSSCNGLSEGWYRMSHSVGNYSVMSGIVSSGTNYLIDIPTKTGYVFAGYFSAQNGGTRYIDENGKGTANMPSRIYDCGPWYAHWCESGQTVNSDGTCNTGCGQGYYSSYMGRVFERVVDVSKDGKGYFGDELNRQSFFSDPNDDTLGNLYRLLSPHAEGEYGVMFDGESGPVATFGTSMCTETPGSNNWQTNPQSYINDWLKPTASLSQNAGGYCWCTFDGYSLDGKNVIEINTDLWVYADKFLSDVDCQETCASRCAESLQSDSDFRGAMFKNLEGCFPETYDITYYGCDGRTDVLFERALTYNENYTILDIGDTGLDSTGYVFNGWNTSSNVSYSVGTSNSPWTQTNGLTLYADCDEIRGYSVTYNCNNSGQGTTPTDNNLYQQNTSVTTQQNTCWAPLGKEFSRWNCGGTYVNAGNSFTITSNTTCTAEWADVNPCEQGDTPTFYSGVPEEYISQNSSGMITEYGLTWAVFDYANISLEGLCSSRAGGFSDAFYDGYGAPFLNSNQAYDGSNCWCVWGSTTVADVGVGVFHGSRNRVVFSQSFADHNQCETNCTSSCLNALASNASFRRSIYSSVQCQPMPVWYDCGVGAGGSATDSNSPYSVGVTVNVLSGAGSCTAPIGYNGFEQWNCSIRASDAIAYNPDAPIHGYTVGDISFVMPNAEVVCSAQWTPINYTVSFAGGYSNNDGTGTAATGEMSAQTGVHYADTITLPDNGNNPPTNGFSLDGYTFSGWKCGSSVNNNATLAANDTFSMPAANVTCTAQWNPNTIYLAWLLNGGTINGSNAPMCTYGTSAGQNGSITPIHDPTRNGYRFTGWTVNAGLPTGYTRLSYLQSDGSQYIDTTITYSALEDIVVNVKAQSDYTSDNNSSNNIALGFGNGSGQWFGVSSAGKWNIGPAPDYSSDVSASNVTDGLEITWSGGAESLKINGVSVTSNREIAVSPTNSLQLFGRNNAGSFQGRIYYVRVFQGGALQRNYIPVQYGNALGMFDTVTGEFFGNQGTGSFTGQ